MLGRSNAGVNYPGGLARPDGHLSPLGDSHAHAARYRCARVGKTSANALRAEIRVESGICCKTHLKMEIEAESPRQC